MGGQSGITHAEARRLIRSSGNELLDLLRRANEVRESRTGRIITYSRKIFIPLTNLCRDRCAYCTFAKRADDPSAQTMTPEQVLTAARAGKNAGCKEALFSLGDKPELRYPEHGRWLERFGFRSTTEYLAAMCRLVFEETGLLPHANPGALSHEEMKLLQPVNASMGMMLESTSDRLLSRGEAHYRCPDKLPEIRLKALRDAGELRIPFTTGILIGIGETLDERVDALFAIRDVNERYGHIQEVIVQNFRAKAGTQFADRPEPTLLDLARTAAVARLIFGTEVNLQCPPNLSQDYGFLLLAGINDWGGVSPVTPDFINPEMAWPHISKLRRITEETGFELRERLAVYPEYVRDGGWIHEHLRSVALRWSDEIGLVSRSEEAA